MVSLSGVMAPGPIIAVTLREGTRSPRAGFLVAVGHGVVEFPLMVLLYGVFEAVTDFPSGDVVRRIVGGAGGVILVWMGIATFRGLFRRSREGEGEGKPAFPRRGPIAAGMLLSAANPHFIVWWTTVGAALVMQAKAYGIWGFLLFALAHWSCDVGWLSFLSFASFRGRKRFGGRFLAGVSAVCGTVLVLFGGMFLYGAFVP